MSVLFKEMCSFYQYLQRRIILQQTDGDHGCCEHNLEDAVQAILCTIGFWRIPRGRILSYGIAIISKNCKLMEYFEKMAIEPLPLKSTILLNYVIDTFML